jgi:hypothetical protein
MHNFDTELRELQRLYHQEINKLAKLFYWNLVEKMSKPPTGYYFLNDLREFMPENKRQLFDLHRKEKDYQALLHL